jgi:type I restriction enzyme M protein
VDVIAIEALIKMQKATLRLKQNELTLKLKLKRIGGDEAKAETQGLINQTATAMVGLNPAITAEKKKITALTKDKTALELRLTKIDSLLIAIGGQLSEDDAKRLILKKLHDIANTELLRYLNAEKRSLIAAVDNLWDKYAVSSQILEQQREQTLTAFSQFMTQLKYLPTQTS